METILDNIVSERDAAVYLGISGENFRKFASKANLIFYDLKTDAGKVSGYDKAEIDQKTNKGLLKALLDVMRQQAANKAK